VVCVSAGQCLGAPVAQRLVTRGSWPPLGAGRSVALQVATEHFEGWDETKIK